MQLSKQKTIPIVLLVLGIIVAAINPRVRVYDGKLFVISCTSKVTFVNNKVFEDFQISAGFDTTKGLADKLVTGLKKSVPNTPGPLNINYLMRQGIENRRPGLITGISKKLESVCTSKPDSLEFQTLR